MTKRLIALVGPCLLAMIAVACGDEGFGASPDAPTPTSVPPTFVRIAVTPVATRTSEPTVPPTQRRSQENYEQGNPNFSFILIPSSPMFAPRTT